jgi:hypothetical protein
MAGGVAPNGGRFAPAQGWDAFAAEVAAHKAPKPRGSNCPENLNMAGNAAHFSLAPQCTCIARNSGQRCKRPAVRGSARCNKHGGLLDVPGHPSNRRLLLAGHYAHKEASSAARKALLEFPRAIQQTARQAVAALPSRLRHGRWHQLALQLATALAEAPNDNGRQLRRWHAQHQATRPNPKNEMHANE